MEGKRPVGVTIFSWLFIISGITILFRFMNGTQLSMLKALNMQDFKGMFLFWWGSLSPIVGLVAGIYLLRMKEWARKTALILAVVTSLVIILETTNLRSNIERAIGKIRNSLEVEKEEIKTRVKAEYLKEVLEKMDKKEQEQEKVLPLVFYFAILAGLLFNAAVVFYFTRLLVKEHFS